MKQILLFATFACLAFVGCNKENDNDILVGTCWDNQDDPEQHLYEYRRICFGALGASYSYKFSMGGKYENYDLKFTYNAPNVKITYPDGSRFGNGYIEEDMLYITDGSHGGVYKK
jgi:hypothetical protein